MVKSCNFCNSSNHLNIYRPFNSKRNAVIKICKSCGLCFSSYGKKLKKISNLFGAAFGGHRSGKTLLFNEFFDDIKAILKKKFSCKKKSKCLIIGGQDSRKIINSLNFFFYEIDVIEPELRFNFKNTKKIKYIHNTFEKFKVKKKYDFIIVPHTLEHLSSPNYFFLKTKSLLSEKGLIYISVPDTSIAYRYEPNITEFFLDKHRFHFTKKTLKNYIIKNNYKILKNFNSSKNSFRSLSFILSIKDIKKNNLEFINAYSETYKIIKTYKDNMKNNIKELKNKFSLLDNYSSKKKVAAWGIGRIFTDYCMRGMKFEKFEFFVDSNYKNQKYLESFLKIKIIPPSLAIKKMINIDKIVVFSDAFYKQIIRDGSFKKYKKIFTHYTNFL